MKSSKRLTEFPEVLNRERS